MTLQELHDIISKTLQLHPRSAESQVRVVDARRGIESTPTVAVADAHLIKGNTMSDINDQNNWATMSEVERQTFLKKT
jgi:hypothetical protein